MRVFLLAALLSLAFAQSHAPIPGVSTLTQGFDMVAGVQNNSFTGASLLPVWGTTYNKNTVWTYTTASGEQLAWSVPDQFTATTLDYSYESIDEALCEKFTEYISLVRDSFSVSVGVTIGNGTSALSANAKFNHEASTYKDYMSNSTSASGFSRHFWALYSLESLPPFLPEMTLSNEFSETVAALPASISTPADQNMYNEVIQYFGTHFSWKADFGGSIHLSTFVSQSLLSEHTASWASNQFSLTFHYYLFNLSGGGFKNQSQIHIDQQFKEAAHTYLSFRGGDLSLQSNTTVNQWVASIPSHPTYLNNTISDLSAAVNKVDSSKGALLQQTIKSYIATGKLPPTDGSVVDFAAYHQQYAHVDLAAPPAFSLRGKKQ